MSTTIHLDGQRKILETLAERKSEDYSKVHFSSFADWIKDAKGVKSPDMGRHLMYYGFQPLYDRILTNEVDKKIISGKLAVAKSPKVRDVTSLALNWN